MFKGIVMELKKDYAIIMKSDGTMVRVNIKPGLKIGDAIAFLQEDIYDNQVIDTKKRGKLLIPLVAVAMITIFFLTPIVSNLGISHKAYAMLTLDINPSLEIEVDKNKKVLKASGLNKDGEDLNLQRLEGMNIEDAMHEIKNNIDESTTITNKESLLVGFAFLEQDDSNFEKEIQDTIKNNFNTFDIMYLKRNKEDAERAKAKGISLGRYGAEVEIDDDTLEDAIEKMSIPELNALLKKYSSGTHWDPEVLEEIQDELKDKQEELEDKKEKEKEELKEKEEKEADRKEEEKDKKDDEKDKKDNSEDEKDNEKDSDDSDNEVDD